VEALLPFIPFILFSTSLLTLLLTLQFLSSLFPSQHQCDHCLHPSWVITMICGGCTHRRNRDFIISLSLLSLADISLLEQTNSPSPITPSTATSTYSSTIMSLKNRSMHAPADVPETPSPPKTQCIPTLEEFFVMFPHATTQVYGQLYYPSRTERTQEQVQEGSKPLISPPPKFTGNKDEYIEWKRKLLAYINECKLTGHKKHIELV
jgi:hypothetical protein